MIHDYLIRYSAQGLDGVWTPDKWALAVTNTTLGGISSLDDQARRTFWTKVGGRLFMNGRVLQVSIDFIEHRCCGGSLQSFHTAPQQAATQNEFKSQASPGSKSGPFSAAIQFFRWLRTFPQLTERLLTMNQDQLDRLNKIDDALDGIKSGVTSLISSVGELRAEVEALKGQGVDTAAVEAALAHAEGDVGDIQTSLNSVATAQTGTTGTGTTSSAPADTSGTSTGGGATSESTTSATNPTSSIGDATETGSSGS
jgi:hypothetical protein